MSARLQTRRWIRVSNLEVKEPPDVLFRQQDSVTSFNPATGTGQQIGTVTGVISGASIEYLNGLTSPTTIGFDNKVVITDLDGDQLRIRNQGTGRFIVPIDATIFGLGGPLIGTYQILSGTGKFASWIGKTFVPRCVFKSRRRIRNGVCGGSLDSCHTVSRLAG